MFILFTETCLEPCLASVMELLCENRKQLLVLYCFHKKLHHRCLIELQMHLWFMVTLSRVGQGKREREDFSFICHIPGVLNINFCNSEKGFWGHKTWWKYKFQGVWTFRNGFYFLRQFFSKCLLGFLAVLPVFFLEGQEVTISALYFEIFQNPTHFRRL